MGMNLTRLAVITSALFFASTAFAQQVEDASPTPVDRRYSKKPSLQMGTVFFVSGVAEPMVGLSPEVAYDFGWVELGLGVSLLRIPKLTPDDVVRWSPLMPRGHVALLPNTGIDLSGSVALLFGRTALSLSVLPGAMVTAELGFDPIGLRITTPQLAITVRARVTGVGVATSAAAGNGSAFGLGAGFAVELAML